MYALKVWLPWGEDTDFLAGRWQEGEGFEVL